MEAILISDGKGVHHSAALWDPRAGTQISTYKGGGAVAYRGLQLLGDSYLLAASIDKPRIHVWPLNNPNPDSRLRLSTPGKVTALSTSPSGAYIVAAISEKLFVWQTCNGRLLANLGQHYQTVTCLKFAKDSSRFASGGEDGLIFLWSFHRVVNEQNPGPVHTFSQHSSPVKDLHFGHCSARARLFSVSLDRTCNVYDTVAGSLLLSLVFEVPLSSVCVSVQETELFVGCTDGAICKFNLHEPPRTIEHHVRVSAEGEKEKRVVFRGHKANILCLSLSTDCKSLLSACTAGVLHVWDVASRQILRTIEQDGSITAAFFVKRFANFGIGELKPSLQLKSLQRIAEEGGKEGFLDVVYKDRDPTAILDFDSFAKGVESSRGRVDRTSRELEEAREEIERLKKINHAMYQYNVKCILGNENIRQ
ncbi:hypothetical protein KM043_003492 [Ampulex compressa]|nr:hypothetical protein KM043_003492 [Ampulex compressa]